jgi:hypothetical protein
LAIFRGKRVVAASLRDGARRCPWQWHKEGIVTEGIVTQTSDRELIAGAANPLGMDGIEFVEF